MENALYLFSAFGISWIIISFYLYSLIKRQKLLESRLDKIRAMLESKVKTQD